MMSGTYTVTYNLSGATTATGSTATVSFTAGSPGTGTFTTSTLNVGTTNITITAIKSAGCTSAISTNNTASVTVSPATTAVAGSAFAACASNPAINITTGSSATNYISVLWTSNGSGTISNEDSLTLATYTPSAAEILSGSTVTLTLTATGSAPCSSVSSSKTMTINGVPTASAGGSQTICSNATATVSGASSSNGTIAWTENGAGSITAGANTLTPTYTAAAGDGGHTVTLTMTVSNGTCTSATATYTVHVTAAPLVAAGSAVTMCTNDVGYNITAGASSANNAGVMWTSNGTGTIDNADSLTEATYTPGNGETGNVTLTLTAAGNSPCGNISATKTLTILPVPQATNAVICAGQSGAMTSSTSCPLTAPAASGPRNPGTAVNNTGAGSVAWPNPENIIAAGTPYATVTTNFSISNYLMATGYGFNLPANAIINGINVAINRQGSSTSLSIGVTDNTVQLLKGGALTGTNKASSTAWPTAMTLVNYGGNADLWGTTWTAANINASNFGVALSVGSLTSRTATVDYIRVTVTYQVPGDLRWYTVSSGGTAIGTGSSFNPVGVPGSGLADSSNDTGIPIVTTYYVECATVAGCRTPVTFTINPLPEVLFTEMEDAYCNTITAVSLTGNHAPAGSFSGAGVTDHGNGTATFNPSVAGPGSHNISYAYTDGNTCLNTAVQTVTVMAAETYYADADGDGFGNPLVTELS